MCKPMRTPPTSPLPLEIEREHLGRVETPSHLPAKWSPKSVSTSSQRCDWPLRWLTCSNKNNKTNRNSNQGNGEDSKDGKNKRNNNKDRRGNAADGSDLDNRGNWEN